VCSVAASECEAAAAFVPFVKLCSVCVGLRDNVRAVVVARVRPSEATVGTGRPWTGLLKIEQQRQRERRPKQAPLQT
jgi:hypothetical protein